VTHIEEKSAELLLTLERALSEGAISKREAILRAFEIGRDVGYGAGCLEGADKAFELAKEAITKGKV
jgi:hypothetical protein